MWWKKERTPSRSGSAEAARQAALDHPDAPLPARVPRGAVIVLAMAGGAVVAFGLHSIQSIVAPVMLALVLTICVHPLRVAMERRGVPRGLATGSVVTAVFLLLAAFVVALVVAFAQFATLLPTFAPQLHDAAAAIKGWLTNLGIGEEQIKSIVSGFDPAKILAFGSSLFGSVANLTAGLVVVLTSLILMASDASFLGTVFDQIREGHPRVVLSLQSFASAVRRYMIATAGLGVAQGILNSVALTILGVPGAFLWGLLSFLCSFIPNVGYFIAIIPPLVFGFLEGGVPTLIWVVVVYGVINAVVQSLVQPRIVGNAVALTQTLTFVSVLFWAVVLGSIGAILAIPLTLLVRTLLVDSDPSARWWRPVLGDLSVTKTLMKEEDETRRSARQAARHRPSDGPPR
jgi:AI-2 transport protein TqsA